MASIDSKLPSYKANLNCLAAAAIAIRKEIRRSRKAIRKAKTNLLDILEKIEKAKQAIGLLQVTLEEKGYRLKESSENLQNMDPTMVTKKDLLLGVYKILQAQNLVIYINYSKDYVLTLRNLKEKWTGIETMETKKYRKLIITEREIKQEIELRTAKAEAEASGDSGTVPSGSDVQNSTTTPVNK